MASYLHHTATTMYPCCVPALGDSKGASCVGLAEAKLQSFFNSHNYFHIKITKNKQPVYAQYFRMRILF